jgi:hypothetical protein
MFHWSDGEGTGDRLDHEGPAIRAALMGIEGVSGLSLITYAQPAKGAGLYAFVECPAGTDEKPMRDALGLLRVEMLQPVATLPRRNDGTLREDLLRLVALNQMTELDEAMRRESGLAAVLKPIIAGRLNFTDRRDVKAEGR